MKKTKVNPSTSDPTRWVDEATLIRTLRTMVAARRSVRAVSRDLNVHHQSLYSTLHGVPITPAVFTALGYERHPAGRRSPGMLYRYRKITTGEIT